MRVIVIPANNGLPVEKVVDGDPLKAMQDIVGGWVEQVHIQPAMCEYLGVDRANILMLVDEEFLYKDYRPNPVGALLYHPLGQIHGDVVLIGQGYDGEGEIDWTDLPREVTLAKVMTLMMRGEL
jgi:hypothetical protein